MRTAEQYDMTTPKQYGSRKHKAASTQCLNKCLFYDLHQCFRIPAALCSNDTKSCYDWIVLMIMVLSLCRLGAPHSTVQSMIKTLANLKHHVRTPFGDSDISQGQENWEAGNGAGPQIWAVVSTQLFAILQADGFVALIICAMPKAKIELAGLAFVDNMDLITNDANHNVKRKCKHPYQHGTDFYKPQVESLCQKNVSGN